MAVLCLAAFYLAYQKDRHLDGLLIAKNLTFQVLPLLVFAFILAGMVQVLVPAEMVA